MKQGLAYLSELPLLIRHQEDGGKGGRSLRIKNAQIGHCRRRVLGLSSRPVERTGPNTHAHWPKLEKTGIPFHHGPKETFIKTDILKIDLAVFWH